MTLIPYTSTTSRYSQSKNWSKILFKGDRKLQTTEIIELQDLIENQVRQINKNLYDFYNIVKGCKVLLVDIERDLQDKEDNTRTYNYIMTGGQAFIEIEDIASYIDIPSFNFSIQNDSVYYIGVTFKVSILKDADETRGPFTGGPAFGELGADRVVIIPTVNIYKDVTEKGGFYPIAIIKPKSKEFLDNKPEEFKGPPDIFYYRNTEVTTQFKDNYLPIYVQNKLDQILYEISDDFIGEGLTVNYTLANNTKLNVKVDPGVAYIKGKRFEYNYVTTKTFNLSDETRNSIIYIYLSEEGIIKTDLIKEEELRLYYSPNNALQLATLIISEIDNIILKDANNLMPEVSDIIKMKQQHERNKQKVAKLSLDIDRVLKTGKGINLSGIFSDSFTSLQDSNTSHPLYDASFSPTIQGITLPYIEYTKDSRSIVLENEDNLTIKKEEDNYIWSSVTSSNQIITRNNVVTSSINVGVSKVFSANLEVSPNIIYVKDSNLSFSYLPDNVVTYLGRNLPSNLSTRNYTSEEITFLIKATGFSANEDNISLKINSDIINSAISFKGTTPGTNTGTYKANESGHVYLQTSYSLNTSNNILYVYLESNSTSASNQIKIVDLITHRSTLNEINIPSCIPRSSSILAGVCATFNIIQSISLTGIEIVLTQFNNAVALNRSILNVSLTKTNFGLPTDEVIATGQLELVEGVPILNSFSQILFDRVASLTPGEYALIFNTTYENLELGVSSAGENDITLGVPGSYNVTEDKLFVFNEDSWEELNETLSLKLIKRIPSSRTNTTTILVENIEEFNAIEVNLPVQLTTNSLVNFQIQGNTLNNNGYFFPSPTTSARIDVNTLGTVSDHPILELDNLNVNLFSYKNSGTWISTNEEFIRPYNFVELSLDMYNPDNSSFNIYFSSNQGQTWELLSGKNLNDEYIYLEELVEVNRSLPLFNYKFRKEGLSFINFNGETIERTQLMIRIDLSVESLETLPFFKNLIVLTY